MTSLHNLSGYEASAAPFEQPVFDTLPLQDWPNQWQPTRRFPTPQSVGESAFLQEASNRLSFDSSPSRYRLGECDLPIAPYREHIVRTIADNQTSVISSETGSGKSSQVGLYLLEAGFPRVFVTQPRILAARELMQRARQNLGDDYQHLAGYLTGNADDSDCPEGARLVYVTEQLLFNMASSDMLRPDDVIINDEAHERTAPTVVLLGLIKQLLPKNPDMRLVVSSATIDTDMFARYLAPEPDLPAPVLTLPGRTYPIIDEVSTESVAEAVHRHMRQQRNVLIFAPGISRMHSIRSRANMRKEDAREVHLLYGDQSPREQAEAIKGDHVVASRVGETSITLPDKDAVVDDGLSNQGGYEAGRRVLKTAFSSIATLMQRRGRVGRTKPGYYTLAVPDDAPPPPAYDDRPRYDPPAIQNTSIAPYALQLLAGGRRLEHLDLLEYPTHENLEYDYALLRRLGATALNEAGELAVTDIGRAMTELPLDAPLARMLVEAGRQVEGEGIDLDALQRQVAAAAAIQQVNGILDMRQGSTRRYARRKRHQEILSAENRSDVLFALDVFVWLYDQKQEIDASGVEDAEEKFERILAANDILSSRYHKAARTYEELCRRKGLVAEELVKPNASQRQRILACQIAGAEELFVQLSKQTHRDKRGERRTLGRRTTVAHSLANLVIGALPFIMACIRATRLSSVGVSGVSRLANCCSPSK